MWEEYIIHKTIKRMAKNYKPTDTYTPFSPLPKLGTGAVEFLIGIPIKVPSFTAFRGNEDVSGADDTETVSSGTSDTDSDSETEQSDSE